MAPVARKRPSSVTPADGGKGRGSSAKKKKVEESPTKVAEPKTVKKNTKKESSKKSEDNAKNSAPVKTPKSSQKNKNKTEKSSKTQKKNETQSVSLENVDSLNIAQLLALGEKSQPVTSQDDQMSSHTEDSSDCENSDFEEVKLDERTEPVIPKEGVDITLEAPTLYKKYKRKGIDVEAHLRRQINKVKKELQLLMHKVHLLCWIAHLKFVNNTVNDSTVMESSLKLIKSNNLYPPKHADLTYLEGILKWYRQKIEFKKDTEDPNCTGGLLKELLYQFEKRQAFSSKAYILMFIILLRVLGLKARIVMSFQVLPVKPTLFELNYIKPKTDANENKEGNCSKEVVKLEDNKTDLNKNKGEGKKAGSSKRAMSSDDEFESKHFKPSSKASGRKSNNGKKNPPKKSVKKEISDDEEDDLNFKSVKKKEGKKKPDKRLSSENEETKKKEGSDLWTEVYLEAEEKWISVDVCRQKIHCVGELYSRATHPVVYVLVANNNQTLKDVTKRYVPSWHSDTRKKRVDEEWWNETMKPYLPRQTAREKEEDEDINRQLTDKPLPCSISEYKDHPLYALKRHLLKFEGIYPPDAPTLGFVRGEPVYARECVVTLRSREVWYKEARVVRLKEEPYKIVKARPKFDKMTGEIKKDLPLELFGIWQTEDYIPPIATDGKVPRNEYGNVDLFKPCMLPIGTVHLQIPALIRVAKKLGIDCAPATVGFDYHSGGSHPVFDGFVVCEEFKETLLDHWNKEVDESAKRSEERKEKRVYGNWKRLIRGLLIREKLKIKYAFGENSDEEDASTSKA